MRISGVESTDLFQGSTVRPLQIIRVTVESTQPLEAGVAAAVRIAGAGVETTGTFGITLPEPGESRSC
jgi:hypothetical protein